MFKNRFFLINNDYVFAIIAVIFAYQINNYFGFIGINVADSFQTFDSGNRILKGDLPFRDYWIISTGPLIDIMQGAFFKMFGVSWSSYVIHASVLNSIFSISVYFFSRLNEISKSKSLFFAILSGLIMYPAAGTPQTDHHAIIIGTISTLLFFTFLKKKKFKSIIFIPIIFLFCFFIKQVPTAYYAIVIAIVSLIYVIFLKENKIVINLFLGSFFALALFFLILKLNNISALDVYKQYISLILSSFSLRIDDHSSNLFLDNIFKIKYIILLLIPLIFVVIQNLKNYNLKNKKNYYLDLYLFLGLLISNALHESYTNNQSVTFGLIPIYSILILAITRENKSKVLFYIFLALSAVGAVRLFNANEIYLILIILLLLIYLFRSKLNIFLKKTSSMITIYTLIISLLYFEDVIKNRYWFDIVNPNWNNAIQAQEIDLKFDGLTWLSNDTNTQNEILDIKYTLSYLKSLNDNFIIITNYQIYNAILNKKNYSPVKYWWNNLTYPPKENKYRNEFDAFFQKKINKNNVKKIVIANDIKDNFEINEFKWLNKCMTKEQKNETFTSYNVEGQC